MLSLVQRICVGFVIAASLSGAQNSSIAEFTAAYQALAHKDYDSAIAHFRTGLTNQPENANARKDLAYTLLKTGDTGTAREEFQAVLKLHPTDKQAALEFAALSSETGSRHAIDSLTGSEAMETPSDRRIHGTSLWAFFDSAYRSRADVDYLARHWHEAGISQLYVGAWHNMESAPAADQYLTHLITACHEHGILVYAWLELPFVSEKFWADHPAWRDKNGLGQDAQIGWRKLMNLQNPECSRAAHVLVAALLDRFDWDGVNLAELSFEGDATSDAEHVTPVNDNVRSEFREIAGFDPLLLFVTGSPHANAKDLATFFQFRTVLQSRLQSDWLNALQLSRKAKPYLDVLLTNGSTIATPDKKQIGLDLSAIDNTSSKLAAAISAANSRSLHVALYSENAVSFSDLGRLASLAANVQIHSDTAGKLDVNTPVDGAGIEWTGAAALDGQLWPLRDGKYILIPPGRHTISAGSAAPPFTITCFNAAIQSATASQRELDIAYQSRSRAPVMFDQNVGKIEVDGAPFWTGPTVALPGSAMLPAGQHLVTFIAR